MKMAVIQNPLVSVIVAIYNLEPILEPCLSSIRNQTYDNFEIILVNDGSTDNSGIICDNFCAKSKNAIVIHKVNQGLASARNEGYRLARGKYIYFMDGDDTIDKNLLKDNLKLAISSDADIIVFGHRKRFVHNQKKIIETIPPHLNIQNNSQLETKLVEVFKNGNGFAVWEQIYKKEFLDRHALIFPNFKRGADMMFLFELYSKYPTLITNTQAYYNYFEFGGHKKTDHNLLSSHIIFFKKFISIYPDWMKIDANKKFALKLFTLWFCHVIPSNIYNNKHLNTESKLKFMKEIFESKNVIEWLNWFQIKNAKENKLTFLMIAILKSRNPYLLYYFTAIKKIVKNNFSFNHKRLFFEK